MYEIGNELTYKNIILYLHIKVNPVRSLTSICPHFKPFYSLVMPILTRELQNNLYNKLFLPKTSNGVNSEKVG